MRIEDELKRRREEVERLQNELNNLNRHIAELDNHNIYKVSRVVIQKPTKKELQEVRRGCANFELVTAELSGFSHDDQAAKLKQAASQDIHIEECRWGSKVVIHMSWPKEEE